jgi:uncharacterized protein
MLQLGKINNLKVIKELDFGIYFQAGEEEILMPTRYIPVGTKIGDYLDVFIYRDSEDRLLATSEKPKIMVDEFALLEVVDTNSKGVFLDWGLPKDLFVPFQEQNGKMQKGKYYVVKAYIDEETDRIVASARIEHFLNYNTGDFTIGQEVDLIPFKQTDLGIKTVVNDQFEGLIYQNEIFNKISYGEKIKGYVYKIRLNGQLDIRLRKPGYQAVLSLKDVIYQKLQNAGGFLPYHDKSDPEAIYNEFGVSKRDFKQSIGGLLKEKKILITSKGIQAL